MGCSGKLQAESGLETEGKKWVIAGISTRMQLSQIRTKPREREGEEEEEEASFRTPTSKEARIPEKFLCPPAPRKRGARPAPRRRRNDVKEFFPTPDDLESLFFRKLS